MLNKLGNVLILSSVSISALAAGNNTVVQDLNTKTKDLSVTVSNSISSSLKKGNENDVVNTLSVLSSYRLNSIYSLSNTLTFDKEFTNDRELKARDLLFTLTRKLEAPITGSFLRVKSSLTAPMSKASRKDSELIAGLSLGVTFGMGLDHIIKGLNFYYLPDMKTSFYKYETGRFSGESNVQYRVLQRLIFEYALADKFSLSFDNIYYRNWTFAGTTTDVFSFDQSIAYQVRPDLSVSVGHSIGGYALHSNGVDSNVKLFDENESQIYTGFDYRY